MSSPPVHYHATLLTRSGSGSFAPARLVEHEGTTYAVSAPGEQFKLVVEARALASPVLASCRIDGCDVGYARALSPGHGPGHFDGWYAGEGKYTDFVFAAVQEQSWPSKAGGSSPGGLKGVSAERSTQEGNLGRVVVTFVPHREEDCECAEEHKKKQGSGAQNFPPKYCKHCDVHNRWFHGSGVRQALGLAPSPPAPSPGPDGQSPEDKKVQDQPSLRATSSGEVCSATADTGPRHLVAEPGRVPVMLTFQCESEERLRLRGVLLPEAKDGAGAAESEAGGKESGKDTEGKGLSEGSRVTCEGTCQAPAGASVVPVIVLDDSDEEAEGKLTAQEKPKLEAIYQLLGVRKRKRRACVVPQGQESPVWVWEEVKEVETVVLD